MTEHTIIAVMMAGQNSLISPACFVLRQYVRIQKKNRHRGLFQYR